MTTIERRRSRRGPDSAPGAGRPHGARRLPGIGGSACLRRTRRAHPRLPRPGSGLTARPDRPARPGRDRPYAAVVPAYGRATGLGGAPRRADCVTGLCTALRRPDCVTGPGGVSQRPAQAVTAANGRGGHGPFAAAAGPDRTAGEPDAAP